MSDVNKEDDDFIIPPFLFSIDEEIDSLSDNIENSPRYLPIPTISLNIEPDLNDPTQNIDSTGNSNNPDVIPNLPPTVTNNNTQLESLLNVRPPAEDGSIPSSFIEMRNNVINTQLNEGNIRLQNNSTINFDENPLGDGPCFNIGGVKVYWNKPKRTVRGPCSRRRHCPESEMQDWSRRLNALRHGTARVIEPRTFRSASQNLQRSIRSRRATHYPLGRANNMAHRTTADRPSSWETTPVPSLHTPSGSSTQVANTATSVPLTQETNSTESSNQVAPTQNPHHGRLSWNELNVDDIFSYLSSVEPARAPEDIPSSSNNIGNDSNNYNQRNSNINVPDIINIPLPVNRMTIPDDFITFNADFILNATLINFDNISSDSESPEPTD